MTKLEARTFQKKRILEITHKEGKEKLIRKKLVACLSPYRTVICYRADKWEVNIDFVLSDFHLKEIDFFFPRVVSVEEKKIEFIKPKEWRKGTYGLMEPIGNEIISPLDAEIAIIPSLGFQKDGIRLGRGAGFYDRAFSGVESKKMIGIGFSEVFSIDFPTNDYDIRVGAVVTEERVLFF